MKTKYSAYCAECEIECPIDLDGDWFSVEWQNRISKAAKMDHLTCPKCRFFMLVAEAKEQGFSW